MFLLLKNFKTQKLDSWDLECIFHNFVHWSWKINFSIKEGCLQSDLIQANYKKKIFIFLIFFSGWDCYLVDEEEPWSVATRQKFEPIIILAPNIYVWGMRVLFVLLKPKLKRILHIFQHIFIFPFRFSFT